MKCLNKVFYKNELKEYGEVLGSEAAAYYLLSINGGYEVEKDPNGEDSKLWLDIYNAVGKDRKKAILEKATYYTPLYLKTNNWLELDKIVEPTYVPSGVSTIVDNPIADILVGDIFDDVKNSLHANGVDNDLYAMHMAIHLARNDYADEEQAKFELDYRQKQIDRKTNPKKFYQKVLDFFKSKANKNTIKDPSAKKKETVRKQAFHEFNETLYHLNVTEMYNRMCNYKNTDPSIQNYVRNIGNHIKELYEKQDRESINDIMVFVDMAERGTPVVVSDKYVLFKLMRTMLRLNVPVVTNILNEFKTVNEFEKAFFSKDKSSYTPVLLTMINDFIYNVETLFMLDLKNITFDDNMRNLTTMFFEQDYNIRCENEAAYDAMKSGLESRLISINRSSFNRPDAVYNIKSRLSKLKSSNMYDSVDMYQVFFDFLEAAENEYDVAYLYLDDYITGVKKDVSADTLMYLKTDVIGYYGYIIQNYINTLSKDNGFSDTQLQDLIDLYQHRVKKKQSDTEIKLKEAIMKFSIDKVSEITRSEVDLGNNEAYRHQMIACLNNEIDRGSLQAGELFFGDANSSKSSMVRAIAHMLNNDERATNRATQQIGTSLLTKYKKCGSILKKIGLTPTNYMKTFCELDNKGLPTGYFVRNVNYGQFEQDKAAFEKKLQHKYNVPVDSTGRPVWNFDVRGTRNTYIKYMDELDDWLDQHCHRRYTGAYYKARRHILTTEARQALDEINEQIQLLQEKCTKNGYVYECNLSLNDRSKLKELRDLKKEISNPYAVTYDSVGNIIKLEKKTGEALEIAESILDFNRFLKGGMDRNESDTKYQNALALITDPAKRAIFESDNIKEMISPEFYDLLSQCSTATQTDEYLKASAERSKILSATKEDGVYIPDLLKLNDESWDELKRLELELEAKRTHGSKGSVNFDDIAEKRKIMIDDPDYPGAKIYVRDYFKRLAQRQMMTDPTAMTKYYDKYFIRIKDSKGRDVLKELSVFSYVWPKDEALYVKKLTTGPYIEYEKSGFLDSKYIDGIGERFQPREDKYHNDVYDKVINDTNMKSFYEQLLNTMDDAIKMLPDGTNFSKYTMPQMTEQTSALQARSLAAMKGGLFFKSFSLHFTINENDDELYRDDKAVRPDNSIVETVPIRYIRKLEDPSMISCDIVNSVTLFFHMADNFKRKSQTVPQVEALIAAMSQNGVESDQVKRAKTELEMYGYGRMQKGFGDTSKKMTKWQKGTTKLANNFRHLANLAMLAGNIASSTKGFVTSQWKVFTEAVVGRYYTKTDLMYGLFDMFTEIGSALHSMGQGDTTSLTQALLQYNGLAGTIEKSFKNQNEATVRRLMSHFRMGTFTIGDYTSNAQIMNSVYHATRLIEVPGSRGELRFVSRTQCRDLYVKNGKGIKDADKAFKKARGNHLRKMYEITEDGVKLKKKVTVNINGKSIEINPKTYVTEKLENRISATVEQRASIANGVASEHGKGAVYQGTLTRYLVVMRGYMVSQGYDRLKTGNDFDETYYNKGGKRSMSMGDEMYRGQYNFETGEVEYGTWKSTFYAIGLIPRILNNLLFSISAVRKIFGDKRKASKLTIMDKQNIVTTLMDVIGTVLFYSLCAFLFLPMARQYPDDWFWMFCSLVSAGCMLETATTINPMTGLDLMTTVTTLYSWVKDLGRTFSYASDLFGFSGHELDEKIRSGAYKDKKRWVRDVAKGFLKPTGITGYYESLTPAIPGLDVEDSKYLQQKSESRERIANQPIPSMDWQSIKLWSWDIYNVSTSPLGVQGKYDYYQSNQFPATLLPKRKDDDSNSGGRSSGRRRSSRSGRNRR